MGNTTYIPYFFLFVVIIAFFICLKYVYYSYLFLPERNGYTPKTFKGKRYYKKQLRLKNEVIDTLEFINFPGNKIVLYCHGQGGDIGTRGYVVNLLTKFELNTFLFDYRGYGNSVGKPTEKTFLEDSLHAYDYLSTKYKPENIIIWGESLGGAAASYVASQRLCYKLVVMSSFSSISDAINKNTGVNKLLKVAMNFALVDPNKNLCSHRWIRDVRCPTAIVHSRGDDIIPFDSGCKLYDNLKCKEKKFIIIEGKHRSPKFTNKQIKELAVFLKRSYQPEYSPKTSDMSDIRKEIQNI